MEAEVRAVWEPLQFCIRKNMNRFHLGSDSLVLKNMITRSWKIPCDLVEMMEEIHDMVGKVTVQVSHIFREANQLADYIANSVINKEEIKTFQNFIHLPSLGRRILNIDKQQIPSIHIKKRRINTNNNGHHA